MIAKSRENIQFLRRFLAQESTLKEGLDFLTDSLAKFLGTLAFLLVSHSVSPKGLIGLANGTRSGPYS